MNPQPMVLETTTLPIELQTYDLPFLTTWVLLGFFVLSSLVAKLAKLFPVNSFRMQPFILVCRIIPLLAFNTFQRNDFPHKSGLLLLNDFRYNASANSTATFTDSKSKFFFHGDIRDKLNLNIGVVTRHYHFRSCS